MKAELYPGEHVVKSGSANLQRGLETVGGKLHLTNQRLVFEAHKFNVQSGWQIIPLGEVADTQTAWTKFLNFIPLAPNSLTVSTTAGVEHRFVLNGRRTWQQAIEQVRAGQ